MQNATSARGSGSKHASPLMIGTRAEISGRGRMFGTYDIDIQRATDRLQNQTSAASHIQNAVHRQRIRPDRVNHATHITQPKVNGGHIPMTRSTRSPGRFGSSSISASSIRSIHLHYHWARAQLD